MSTELNYFICPHCHKQITFKDLTNDQNNSEHFIEFKKKLESEYKKEIENKLRSDIFEQFQTEFRKKLQIEKERMISENNLQVEKQKNILLEDTSKQIQQLQINNSELTNELKNSQEKFNFLLKSKLDESTKDFLQQKNELEKQIENLKGEIKLIKNSTELELTKQNQKQLEQLKEIHQVKIDELNKQIADLEKFNATNRLINNKVKGENWENEVEEALRKLALISGDKIEKITQAGNKADFRQIVINNNEEIGRITFECKNAEWKDTWELKLAQDMLQEKADYAILVATSTEEKFHTPFLISQKNKNIFIASPDSFELITALVRKLILIENKNKSTDSTDSKLVVILQWLQTSFVTFKELFGKTFESIEASEKTIRNKVEDITKNREKILRKWEELVLNFIDNFSN